MRLPAEFAFVEEFVGDTEPRPAAYSNVREEQSTGITHKLPAKANSAGSLLPYLCLISWIVSLLIK
ncbi:MAG: palindromic element RPE1 domain-containing protein [Rickettsia sp.]|nr:palindromic element RPE1 domain-containing protein [Rickettsia sp.]